MFFLFVTFFAAVLGLGFWFDNAITHLVLQFWWVFLLFGYIVLCALLPSSAHRFIHRYSVAISVAVLVLLSTWVFDDVVTIYITGAIYLVAWGLGCYASDDKKYSDKLAIRSLMLLVALTLVILPVSVNRILVKLPNLSAGTSFTLHESLAATPDLDAYFYNRKSDKLEIEISLGSQIYIGQPHEAPRLEIETGIQDVVVRLLSISYQHRLAYLDLSLFDLTEDELFQISITDDGASVDMTRDLVFLLLTGFKVGEPVWFQLPHMENHEIPIIQRGLIVLFRLLLWLLICFAITVWLPRKEYAGSKMDAA